MLPPVLNPALFVPHEVLETSKNLAGMYQNALIDNPVATKAITSGVLATAGDLVAQLSTSKQGDSSEFNDDETVAFEYDFARGIGFLVFGAAYTGIFQHYWFDYLSSNIQQWGESLKLWGPAHVSIPVDAVYGLKNWWAYFDVVAAFEDPPSNEAVAIAKLALNQFLMVPIVYMPLFFAVTGSLAKMTREQSSDRAKNMYIPLLQRNYFYWLPVQFFQFLVVPSEYQILFISVASVAWTIILSTLATNQQQQQAKEQLPASAGADSVIDVTDSVTLADVEEALLPEAALNLLDDPKLGPTTLGGVLGLLTSAANDGVIGAFVSNLLGATIGSGVAVSTAAGAVIGLLLAKQNSSDEASDDLEPSEAVLRDGPESQLRQQQKQQQSQGSSAYRRSPGLQAQAQTPSSKFGRR